MNRFWVFIGLIIVELIAVVGVFQILASVECRLTDVETGCRILRGMVARAVSVMAILTVLFVARPVIYRTLYTMIAEQRSAPGWVGIHVLGLAVIFVPTLSLANGDLNANFASLLWGLVAGAVLSAVGALFWATSPGAWKSWISEYGRLILPAMGLGVLLPDVANLVLPLWGWDVLTNVTFAASHGLLGLMSDTAFAVPEQYALGAEKFYVIVASQCSGVEGFALVTVFLALYSGLFRKDILMGRFWLIMLPLALMASWVLNVVRITTLIMLGAYVSPDLAMNGFHSYAGWLFFTLLALGVLAFAQVVPWFNKKEKAAAPSLSTDWVAACLLPFVIFMFSGVVVFAFWSDAALGYPYKAAALFVVLWYFRKGYLKLDWVLDPVAIGGGLLVGIGWVAMGVWSGTSDADASAVSALAGLSFAIWMIARLAGTVLFVPLIEELFFRGYVLQRLDTGSVMMRIVALTVSSGLFALLHGRWLEAFAAGLIFGVLMLRKGRLTDAVIAHMAANLTVALWASATGNWDMI